MVAAAYHFDFGTVASRCSCAPEPARMWLHLVQYCNSPSSSARLWADMGPKKHFFA